MTNSHPFNCGKGKGKESKRFTTKNTVNQSDIHRTLTEQTPLLTNTTQNTNSWITKSLRKK